MIDWDVAISTGVRWVRPGPQVSLADARAVVAELRELAAAVAEPVHEVTGMFSAEDAGRVAVVDRPGWIRANVDGFRVVLDPLAAHLREQGRAPDPGSMIASVGSRVTGMQAGLILAYLAGRVLGQYELFLPPDAETPDGAAPAGRLTLVAPNILMVERELGVDPHDFRRWVCLHEETHRTQFTSVHLAPRLRAGADDRSSCSPPTSTRRPFWTGCAPPPMPWPGRCGAATATASSRPSRPRASGRSSTASPA